MIKLTILGSGVMSPTIERNPSGFLLEIGKKKLLLDCGFGIIRRLVDFGYDIRDIDCIFISHFHEDHFADAFAMIEARYVKELYFDLPHKKMTMIAPQGTAERLVKWREIYWMEPNENPHVKIYEGPQELKLGDIRLNIFETTHVPWFQSQGVVIRYKRKKIVYTGDIGGDHNLNDIIELARGADLLITEAGAHKKSGSHITYKQAYTIAKVARVKKFLVTHVNPKKIDYVTRKCNEEENFIMGIDGLKIKI